MHINNLFFYIYYCNIRQANGLGNGSRRVTRTLQHHELLLISKGRGNAIVENKRLQFKEGMICYISPNVQHTIEVDNEEQISFLSVHFSYADVDFSNNKWNIRDGQQILAPYFVRELRDYYHINDTFKKLVESWNLKLPGYDFIAKALLQQLIYEIYQNLRRENKNYSVSLKIEKIIEYMRQNIDKKVTLNELSDMTQLSYTYLSRVFKETTGYSLIGFFNKMKVDKAKEYIIDGDKKVKEIARMLGFTDEFYFSRIFKKIEGVSPLEFYSKNVHEV